MADQRVSRVTTAVLLEPPKDKQLVSRVTTAVLLEPPQDVALVTRLTVAVVLKPATGGGGTVQPNVIINC